MGLMMANKAIFTHTHKLENGTVVTHAHPYNKTDDSKPFKSHHHSSTELLFFNNVELLFFALILVLILIKLPPVIRNINFTILNYSPTLIHLHKGRSPPFHS